MLEKGIWFQFVYLGLSERVGNGLRADREVGPTISRKEFLTNIFNGIREFNYRTGEYAYVPFYQGNKITVNGDEYIIGRIGKKRMNKVGLGPSEGFHESKIEDWRSSVIIICLESDSQIVAVQFERNLNYPELLKKMINSTLFNERTQENNAGKWQNIYDVSPELIKNPSDFWGVFDESKGNIKKVVLSFNPPNGVVSEQAKKLKELIEDVQKSTNTDGVDVVLNAREGNLEDHDGLLKDSVQYLMDGGGSADIIGERNKKLFSSGDREASPFTCKIEGQDNEGLEERKQLADNLIKEIITVFKNRRL